MTDARPIAPLRKVVTVKAPPDRAFRRFTEEIGRWWPLASHSVGEADAETVTMDGRVGGRIVERIRGGREAVWGTVTAWDPPRRVAFTWHPGDDPARAQDIEVSFTPDGDRTRVALEHRGFERLGKAGPRMRRAYPIGWAYVLALYAERGGLFVIAVRALTAALMAIARRRRKNQV